MVRRGTPSWNYFLGDWNYFNIWLELFQRMTRTISTYDWNYIWEWYIIYHTSSCDEQIGHAPEVCWGVGGVGRSWKLRVQYQGGLLYRESTDVGIGTSHFKKTWQHHILKGYGDPRTLLTYCRGRLEPCISQLRPPGSGVPQPSMWCLSSTSRLMNPAIDNILYGN